MCGAISRATQNLHRHRVSTPHIMHINSPSFNGNASAAKYGTPMRIAIVKVAYVFVPFQISTHR